MTATETRPTRAGLEEIHRQELETLRLEHRRSIKQLREVQSGSWRPPA